MAEPFRKSRPPRKEVCWCGEGRDCFLADTVLVYTRSSISLSQGPLDFRTNTYSERRQRQTVNMRLPVWDFLAPFTWGGWYDQRFVVQLQRRWRLDLQQKLMNQQWHLDAGAKSFLLLLLFPLQIPLPSTSAFILAGASHITKASHWKT